VNTLAREKLCEAVALYGQDLCDEPQRCEAVLNDLCRGNRREVGLLVAIAKEGLASDLRISSVGVPHNLLLGKHVKNLQNLFFTEEAARWGIESWALALGLISNDDLSESTSRATTVSVTPIVFSEAPVEAVVSKPVDKKKPFPTGYYWAALMILVALIITVVSLILKYQADKRASEALAAKAAAEQTIRDLRIAKTNAEQQANGIIQEKTKALEETEAERQRLQSLMPNVSVDNLNVELGYNSIILHTSFQANNLQSVQCVVEAHLYNDEGYEMLYWNKPITDSRTFTPNTTSAVYADVTLSIYPRSIGLSSGTYLFKVIFRRMNGDVIHEANTAPFSYAAS
jgi:hypothetical protein